MSYNLTNKLVIAISSRALFNLEESNKIFKKKGLKAYYKHQIKHENSLLEPGAALGFVKRILNLNNHFDQKLIEVIILSKNNAATGLRIHRAIEHYGLDIERAAWTAGGDIKGYLKAFKVDLFLSASKKDVQLAVDSGVAAARILPKKYKPTSNRQEVRIAFDGDAVLFSDESEKVYQSNGLEAFIEHERTNAKNPLPKGPFAPLLKAISIIQSHFELEKAPIKTALVTARNFSTFERVIRTFDAWGVRVDEAFFLGGVEKRETIKAFGADIFFDDQDVHLERASKDTPSGKVPTKRA